MTRFEEIGGRSTLRPLIDDFVDRCFDDTMIGFFFRHADRRRVKKFEYQHAARWLGARVEYRGRPLEVAHGPHPIMGGQFMRRLRILEETLEAHAVPEPIRRAWLAHQESLRDRVTRDRGSECTPRRTGLRILTD